MYAICRNMQRIDTDHVLIVSHVFSIIAYIGDNLQGIPILIWISQQCKQFNSSVNILWGKQQNDKKFPNQLYIYLIQVETL